MKLLCICPIGIGNYLLCYPAWKLLHSSLPDAELHLLILRKSINDLAGNDPLWQRIHCIEPTKKQSVASAMNFISQLRAERYTVSLSFFPSNKWQYNLLPFLAGAKKRYAFHYHLKRIANLSMLNHDLLPVDPQLHDVRQNITLVAHFLQKDLSSAPITFPTLYTSTDPSNAIDQLPQNSNGYLAIHPGSSAEHGMDAKRWPAERFGYLADRICSELHCTALLFGGSDETDLKQQTASVMQQPSVIIPPVSLPQTAALLSKCHCCLCNDSGIMHLAAACHLPTIALFGPTDERRNGPFGDNHCIIRKAMAGFPLWTAANVGTRLLPAGIDPRRSLMELSVEEAWKQCKDFIQQFKTD